jgi:hypothetical protein
MRDEGGRVDIEPVGRQSFDPEHGVGALRVGPDFATDAACGIHQG